MKSCLMKYVDPILYPTLVIGLFVAFSLGLWILFDGSLLYFGINKVGGDTKSTAAAVMQAGAAIISVVALVAVPIIMKDIEKRQQKAETEKSIRQLAKKVYKDYGSIKSAFELLNKIASMNSNNGSNICPWELDSLAAQSYNGEVVPFNDLGTWPGLYTSLCATRDNYGNSSQYFPLLTKLCEVALVMAEAYEQLEFKRAEVEASQTSGQIWIHGTFRLWMAFARVEKPIQEIRKEFEAIFGDQING